MKRLALILGPAFAVTLLGACSTAPMMPDKAWTVEPVMTVRHGSHSAAGYYALGRQKERRPPPEKALGAYRQAVEADPAFVPAWNALGTLHARLGQLDEAVRALQRAVELAPTASHLHNNLGYALLLARRDEAAAGTLRRAVHLDPDNRRAWRNLADAYRRLGEPANAVFADARANGGWAGKIHTPTPAAAPMPIGSAAAAPIATPAAVVVVAASAPPKVASTAVPPPSAAAAASRSSFAIQAFSATRLVKIAENVYELRTTSPATAAPAPHAAAPAESAAHVVPLAAGGTNPRPAAATVAFISGGPARASAPAATPSPPVRYEVSNGHGRNGLARRVATLLQQGGMKFPRLTNQRPFNVPASVVQYRPGYRDAAEALAARLPFRPATLATPSAGLVSDVRLVLGHDLGRSEACAELNLCPQLAVGTIRPAVAATGAGEQAPN